MHDVTLADLTLRDGNHAVRHQLSCQQVAGYARMAEKSGVAIVEVGHGNGLGASSMQVGLAKESDKDLLEAARAELQNTKLGVHVIPGFATIDKDLRLAMDIGVDCFRIAAHCTEADITERHIGFVRQHNKTVYGVLMMSHMAPTDILVEEAAKLQSYGAEGVIIMDSAGHYLPSQVEERISALRAALNIAIGFHGHNNMGMAIANSMVAYRAGATILDGCARGFGAGAGNTQLETLLAVLERENISSGVDLYAMLDAADYAEKELIERIPHITSTSVVSGMAGVFSGFLRKVERAAEEYQVDARDIFFELGKRKVVAGQEDVIIEVAIELSNRQAA